MSRYGSAFYGSTSPPSYYGEPGGQYDATPFNAVGLRYNQILLTWRTIAGTWDLLRLVRNRNSFPETADDGTILVNSAVGPNALASGQYGGGDYGAGTYGGDGSTTGAVPTSYDDAGLKAGFWYYSLFVRDVTGGVNHWRRVGDATGQACADLGYTDYLANRLPRFLLNDAGEVGGGVNNGSQLYRYLGIYGLELSRIKGLYDGILLANDPDHVPGPLLPHVSKQLGFCYEPNIGMRHNRVLLRNAVRLGQLKGTSKGITAMASSLTGWGCSQKPLQNRMLSQNDSSADSSIGSWIANIGTTLVRDTVLAPPSDGTAPATSRPGVFKMTAFSGTRGAQLGFGSDGIPVPGNTVCTLSGYFYSGASSSINYSVSFYDKTGTLISNTGALAAVPSSNNTWSRNTSTFTSPVGAVWAGITISSTVDCYFDSLQFMAMSTPNLISANAASIETDASGWVSEYNCDLSQYLGIAADGAYSLRVNLHAGAPDNVAFRTATAAPVTPGQTYTAMYSLVSGTSTRNFGVAIEWHDSSDVLISTSTATSVTSTGSAFTQTQTTAVAPAGAVKAYVYGQIIGLTSTTEFHFVDKAGLFAGTVSTWSAGYQTSVAYEPSRSIDLVLSASRINQVLNGGFDVAVSGWTSFGCTSAQSTVVTYDGGLGSAKLVSTLDNVQAQFTSSSVAWSPGQVASVSLKYVQGNIFASGTPVASVAINFLDSGNHILAPIPTTVISPSNTNDLNWHTLTINGGVAPANTVAAQVVFTFSAYTGDTVYVDDVVLEKAAVSGPYFDSRENPSETFWEGTANNSRLHLYPNYLAKAARLGKVLPDFLPVGAEFQTLVAQP